jgi:hypothetical protein
MVVEAAMDGVRGGALRRAVLYEVEAEGGGGKNLKECVKDADGKVAVREGKLDCAKPAPWGDQAVNGR